MKIRTNPLLYSVISMAIIMAFYSLERLIFLIWNYHGFHEAKAADIFMAFVQGLRFDLCAILIINALIYLLAWVCIEKYEKNHLKILAILTIIINLPFFAVDQVDIEFSNFLGRRMTRGNLNFFNEAQGKISGFIMTYGSLIFLQVIVTLIMIFCLWKIAQILSQKPRQWKLLNHVLFIVLSLPFIVLGIRGGLQRKPLAVAHAIQFESSYLNQMVLNSAFTLIRGESKNLIVEKHDFANLQDLKPYLNASDETPSVFTEDLSKKKMNVVVVILESFSQEYLEFAPFLRELANKGLYFDNAYANGRRSIEAISSIMASIPSLMSNALVTTPYFNDDFPGLGSHFKKLNYHTSFFHGGLPGTMYFDLFTKKTGFDHYYSSASYTDSLGRKITEDETDNFWGIYDEPFLQYMAGELDKFPQPFISSVFTLTSHHPYKLPIQYLGSLPTGKIPILQTVAYTDMAIKKFFDTVSKKPWFNNTLFIFTADHTQMPYTDAFDCALGRYRIPIIFYSPSIKWPKTNTHKMVQQVDILPTVMDMFKMDGKTTLFGKSFFKPTGDQVVLLSDQTYYILKDDFALQMRPDKKEYFNIKNDFKLRNPLPTSSEDLEKPLKATIQYYNNGLLENKLVQ